MKRLSPFPLFLALVLTVGVSCSLFSTSTPAPVPYEDRALKFVPDSLPEAQQGVSYTTKVTIENVLTFVAEFSISEGSLPAGLSLERVKSENAVNIIGTPTEKGRFVFTLHVICFGTNDPGQEGDHSYAIVVK